MIKAEDIKKFSEIDENENESEAINYLLEKGYDEKELLDYKKALDNAITEDDFAEGSEYDKAMTTFWKKYNLL